MNQIDEHVRYNSWNLTDSANKVTHSYIKGAEGFYN